MNSLPFALLLVPYGLILIIATLFLFFNIFHLWRYGVEGTGTRLMIVAYLGLFVFTVFGTFVALSGYPWGDTFSLSDLLPSFNTIPSL